jgi:hypothetical protein
VQSVNRNTIPAETRRGHRPLNALGQEQQVRIRIPFVRVLTHKILPAKSAGIPITTSAVEETKPSNTKRNPELNTSRAMKSQQNILTKEYQSREPPEQRSEGRNHCLSRTIAMGITRTLVPGYHLSTCLLLDKDLSRCVLSQTFLFMCYAFPCKRNSLILPWLLCSEILPWATPGDTSGLPSLNAPH